MKMDGADGRGSRGREGGTEGRWGPRRKMLIADAAALVVTIDKQVGQGQRINATDTAS